METENNKKELIPSNKQLNISISNLARQLESGEIEPASRSKDELRKCAMLFKSRGYSNSAIAEILNVDDRTVYRYIEKVKAENSLEFGFGFQKKLITEVINNWRMRCQRLLRLSYSGDLTKYEQASDPSPIN